MSLAVQEQVLFDLLFNQQVREQFIKNQESTLDNYSLTDDERNDFLSIKAEALALDAKMRAGLLLSHISRSFPVSFSLLSSLPDGLALLRKGINTEFMHTPPIERVTAFGNYCRQSLANISYTDQHELSLIIAIVEAELGMTWTAAMLKQTIIERGKPLEETKQDKHDWANRPIKLADYVNAAMLPMAYSQLKQKLCPKNTCDIWNAVSQKPLAAARRKKILQEEDGRLLIAKAKMTHFSQCDPVVEHQTLELSEGFAHLFQHVNGTASVTQLLNAFKQAGAPEALLKSVKSGFKQLIDEGMLMLIS